MRWIGGWLLVLISTGWLLCEIELPSSGQRRPMENQWRRSARGWEDTSKWFPPPAKHDPAVHPLLFGSLEIFLAIFVLATLPDGCRRHAPEKNDQDAKTGPPSESG